MNILHKADSARLIFIAIGLLVLPTLLGGQPFEFQRLSEREKFLQGAVLAIEQDSIGFVWLGTRSGLYRYDGNMVQEFRHQQKDSTSLSNNYVSALHTDRQGALWVGTRNGLNRMDPVNRKFERFLTNQNPEDRAVSRINCVFEDSKARLWIGTDGGLVELNRQSAGRTIILTAKSTQGRLPGDTVRSVIEDREGNLWFATSSGLSMLPRGQRGLGLVRVTGPDVNPSVAPIHASALATDQMGRLWIGTSDVGLFRFDARASVFQRFQNRAGSPGLIHPNIRKIVCDPLGRLWIGTQEGLTVLDPQTMLCSNYQHEPENSNSLSQNSIYDIKVDEAGSVWIGTYFGGANLVYAFSTPFQTVRYLTSAKSISNNVVSSFATDGKGHFWIGTEGGGLNYWDKNNNSFKTYKNRPGDPSSLSSNLVKGLYRDKSGAIWVATHFGGLNRFDPTSEKFERMPEGSGQARVTDATSVFEDSYNRLWVGTENNGILLFDRTNQSFLPYLSNPNTPFRISSNYVKAIFEDRSKNIWIATENGLDFLSNRSNQFVAILPPPVSKAGLLDEVTVNCIQEDNKGNIWVGTQSQGLIMLSARDHEQLKIYRENDGLAGNAVYGILQDNRGFLWISTDNGLSRLDPEIGQFISFRMQDGLPGNAFNNLAYLKSPDGQMLFGGFQGFVHFDPESIEVNDRVAATVFTGLKVNDHFIFPGDKSGILSKDLNGLSIIELPHDQNVFTIYFANLNYVKPAKNQYAWKLEGVDEQWHTGFLPSASFTNLKPGTYTLQVKGSNNDGQWNETPAVLKIRILAPAWGTWWAYTLYWLIAGIVSFFFMRFLWLRSRFRRETAMQQFKLDFFTSLSHEIRTHLSLIIGPVERLLLGRHQDSELNEQLGHIKKNADRLMSLVNEMMDLRKAETNNIVLHKTEENLVLFLREIFSSIKSAAQEKNIQASFNSTTSQLPLTFDRVQMEKVFFNLLTNALKFTPEGGEIILSISQDSEHVIVSIQDNGIGIPPEHIDKVFKSYYQVHNGQTNHMGYGIGLALAKALVNLHQGTLEVESTPASQGNPGNTIFTIKLPKTASGVAPATTEQVSSQSVTMADTMEQHQHAAQPPQQPSILLIEDNNELRHFIAESFVGKFSILEADNGETGLSKALLQVPDLVISDIMLPGIDGLEVCRQLKADTRTSHIPVILLTAKANPEHQVAGMHSGADAYITKPFSPQLLDLQVGNLLASRAAMRQRYVHQVTLEPRQIEITNADEVFLNRVIESIENNMDNPDFGVNMLRVQMAMSLTVLYKKIHALTGMSVNEFIKSIKLKKAAVLLIKSDLNVSEIAYKVGFNDRKYFSREFKKQFGKTPSEYTGNEK